jgi:hypothetical protein
MKSDDGADAIKQLWGKSTMRLKDDADFIVLRTGKESDALIGCQ